MRKGSGVRKKMKIATDLGEIEIRLSEEIPDGATIATRDRLDGITDVFLFKDGEEVKVGEYDFRKMIDAWDSGSGDPEWLLSAPPALRDAYRFHRRRIRYGVEDFES